MYWCKIIIYIWIKHEYSFVEYKTFSKILALLHLAKAENVNLNDTYMREGR
jgi:hypothetical protein